jgi:hypothetical protein
MHIVHMANITKICFLKMGLHDAMMLFSRGNIGRANILGKVGIQKVIIQFHNLQWTSASWKKQINQK